MRTVLNKILVVAVLLALVSPAWAGDEKQKETYTYEVEYQYQLIPDHADKNRRYSSARFCIPFPYDTENQKVIGIPEYKVEPLLPDYIKVDQSRPNAKVYETEYCGDKRFMLELRNMPIDGITVYMKYKIQVVKSDLDATKTDKIKTKTFKHYKTNELSDPKIKEYLKDFNGQDCNDPLVKKTLHEILGDEKEWKKKPVHDSVQKIYEWLGKNLKYDYAAFRAWKENTEAGEKVGDTKTEGDVVKLLKMDVKERSTTCGGFAYVFATLCRAAGIPVRSIEYCNVGTNRLHCVTEVYFPEVGWVRIDPTRACGKSFKDALKTNDSCNKSIQMYVSNSEVRSNKDARPFFLDSGDKKNPLRCDLSANGKVIVKKCEGK